MDIRRSFRDLNFFQSEITNHDGPIYQGTLNERRRMFSCWQKQPKVVDSNGELNQSTSSSNPSNQVSIISGSDSNGVLNQSNPALKPKAEYHWEALERILYIFAKANHSIGYIQGMNSLICPLYFVCSNDKDESNSSIRF